MTNMLPPLIAAALLACSGSLAQAECAPVPNHIEAETALLDQLANAPSARVGQELSSRLWGIYLDAPDEAAQALLDEGMDLRRVGDYISSIAVLDRLIAYCPHYAEGWNQRAFSHYLATDFPSALEDLDNALALNPRHVPALSGKALTLIGMGRGMAAQKVLRDALKLNPWLPERAYLVGPPGQDI